MKPAFAAMTLLLSSIAADDPPSFKITTRRTNDRVTVKLEKNTAIFAIQSPFGISQAVIERNEEKWPDAVVLRLHLKGLENFRVSNGKVKLEASVSLQDGKPQMRLWKDGKEDMPLASKSPYWIDLRILTADGSPAKEIPLKEGYFEMRLPTILFVGNPKSITLNWIDFYRN